MGNITGSLLEDSLGNSSSGLRGTELFAEQRDQGAELLRRVLNEFGETEINESRRDELISTFESGIEEEFRKLVSDPALDFESVKEFLRKRLELTDGETRSVTLDLIDQIRKEGFDKRLETKLDSVKSELKEEAAENPSEEKKQEIKEVMNGIEGDFREKKKELATIGLANDSQCREYNQMLTEFFSTVDNKVNTLFKNES